MPKLRPFEPAIVITSIFEPSEAVKSYAAIPHHNTIVAGDRKTPSDWSHNNTTFLSMEDQLSIGIYLHKILPSNHYCRKLMGYLFAMQNEANCIVDTDDDNYPKENWQFPNSAGDFACIEDNQGFINTYQLYTDQKIWPRGLPLKKILVKQDLDSLISYKPCKVGIWQGLVDGDPDVDAIYRLTDNTPCYFKEREPIVLGEGTLSPFNSQNTWFCKELFPLLYLPAFVTFRFTDILRGLVAQPIMWSAGYLLGFTQATVVQKRNEHDFLKDFISEIPVYQHADEIIEITQSAVKSGQSISDNLTNVYEALFRRNIVIAKELEVLDAWLKDVQEIEKNCLTGAGITSDKVLL